MYGRKMSMPKDMIRLRVDTAGNLYAAKAEMEPAFTAYLDLQHERMEAGCNEVGLPHTFRLTTWRCFMRDEWPKRQKAAEGRYQEGGLRDMRVKNAKKGYGMHVWAWHVHRQRSEPGGRLVRWGDPR